MGAVFYSEYSASKAVFDLADHVLDIKVSKICFEENDLLNCTQYTQPALVTTCLFITNEIFSRGIFPDVMAGYSLGEYVAIAVAGGFSFKTAVCAVRERGIYMEQAYPLDRGIMYAVEGMNKRQIESCIKPGEKVYIANYNSADQIVLTGEREAVEKTVINLKKEGAAKCTLLKVSGPFRSPLLKDASRQMQSYLKNIEINKFKIPYVTNDTAEYIKDSSIIKDLLGRNICAPVLFQQSIETMINNGVEIFVEIGPGHILSGLIKK